MSAGTPLQQQPGFSALQALATRLREASIAHMLASDSERATDFTVQAAGLQLDYSKQMLDREALAALLQLAEESGVPEAITALLNGEPVNNTEGRPALHTLLRATEPGQSRDLYEDVAATRDTMRSIANRLNDGLHTGYSGSAITDVVNIGIGGSDLGPRLATEALKPFHGKVRCHYVANVDPADIENTLADLDPATTLFIVCSKSFRTEETLTNSLTARAWMLDSGASTEDLAQHFLAVTTNLGAAREFGIPADNCLPMWDWVGGRYSVWSAVGLSTAIAVGWDNFDRFLGGARAMDNHFSSSAAPGNMPLLMALLEVWHCNFLGAGNHVVLPYDDSLKQLPDFLQQLTMESNGKAVTRDGQAVQGDTAPVLWGSAGTIGQHSFHQLLHQGTLLCPADFIMPLNSHSQNKAQHRRLVANCLAQSRAMMVGRSLEQSENALLQRGHDEASAKALAPHLVMPGNRPNSVITMHSLTPETLGALLALYEHRTFCSSVLWGINAFDQWGVELGKEIGAEILSRLEGGDGAQMDAATERLMQEWEVAVSRL